MLNVVIGLSQNANEELKQDEVHDQEIAVEIKEA
jgi:hypothetical protein